MIKLTEEYQIGDHVDVYPRDDDEFFEFSGRIVDIDLDTNVINVVDQDDDVWQVDNKQIQMTYNERADA
jgi:hypothetical protein